MVKKIKEAVENFVKKVKETVENFVKKVKETVENFVKKIINNFAKKLKRVKYRKIKKWEIATIIIAISLLYTLLGNGDNCLRRQWQIKASIEKNKKDIDSLNRLITIYKTTIDKIDNDDEYLEEFARENFYMSHKGEEIIIIEKIQD